MCLIVHKPAGVEVPAALIRSAWEDNSDGAGIMYREGDRNEVIKVMPRQYADPAGWIHSAVERLRDVELGLHFRYRTHGPADEANAHPYPIPGRQGAYIMHNGVIGDGILGPHYKAVSDVLSDTGFYVITALPDAPDATDPDFWEIVGKDVGAHNRMLLLDTAGKFLRVNDKSWSDYKGLRLSNELSCPENAASWRRYHFGTANYVDYSDRMVQTSTTDRMADDEYIVEVDTGSALHPAKLSRRDRKILNACLRANSWGPLRRAVRGQLT